MSGWVAHLLSTSITMLRNVEILQVAENVGQSKTNYPA